MLEDCKTALLEYNQIELGLQSTNSTIKLFLNRNKNLYDYCLQIIDAEHCDKCKELIENDLPYDCLCQPAYCTRKNFTIFQKFIYSYEEILSYQIV